VYLQWSEVLSVDTQVVPPGICHPVCLLSRAQATCLHIGWGKLLYYILWDQTIFANISVALNGFLYAHLPLMNYALTQFELWTLEQAESMLLKLQLSAFDFF